MLIAIVAACMSTGDGSILAMGTCFSHNILRRFAPFEQSKLLRITRAHPPLRLPPPRAARPPASRPLWLSTPPPAHRRPVHGLRASGAGISTVFWTALSIGMPARAGPTRHVHVLSHPHVMNVSLGIACAAPDQTGYLLIVAFDIMLAGSVIPLFAAVYWPSCKPIAAFASIMVSL